ncbi:MAG: class I SAM-dependent methyltransferase [Anaerolineae bacterium]|nr:class I SAM-dependent methyltransferase [Anaerolineae bacterium]MDW8070550.1 class I SAM-dependent methyltransferase [Anaerolineae bacterium]
MGVSKKAAERGVPSQMWRAGQERRLAMIRAAAEERRHGAALDVGCGVGVYLAALRADTPHVFGVEVEGEYARAAATKGHVAQALGERLPFADDCFDLVLSHEVIEHVVDDRACVREMVRVLKPGGRLVLFCPNRWYPFETHGHYWRGVYHFGNTPLVNYLPDPLRNRLVPHVRAYTIAGLRRLFEGLPVRIVMHTQIYPGYDNLVARWPALGRFVRWLSYRLEHTPLRLWGLSHFLVVEKRRRAAENSRHGN